jgi:hypothetical protein
MKGSHFLQEEILLPLGDLFTDQNVSKHLKFLQTSRFWTREEIDNFQNQRLFFFSKAHIVTNCYKFRIFFGQKNKIDGGNYIIQRSK